MRFCICVKSSIAVVSDAFSYALWSAYGWWKCTSVAYLSGHSCYGVHVSVIDAIASVLDAITLFVWCDRTFVIDVIYLYLMQLQTLMLYERHNSVPYAATHHRALWKYICDWCNFSRVCVLWKRTRPCIVKAQLYASVVTTHTSASNEMYVHHSINYDHVCRCETTHSCAWCNSPHICVLWRPTICPMQLFTRLKLIK